MKKQLRKAVLERREALSPETVIKNSHQILERLVTMTEYLKAKNVMLYLSFQREVMTQQIISDLFQHRKRVFIPVTVPKTKELIVSELLSLEDDLEVGNFGVLEPKKEALRPFSAQELDLVLVPGVAFDTRGYRIGYGAGYYDRFLPTLTPGVPTIGLAHEVQMIEQVPNDSYDIPVEKIVTEDRLILCK
ncbi:5-formyltetrahydrofolate cyclo-ligase [Alkaliphilus crotonatoxidans]